MRCCAALLQLCLRCQDSFAFICITDQTKPWSHRASWWPSGGRYVTRKHNVSGLKALSRHGTLPCLSHSTLRKIQEDININHCVTNNMLDMNAYEHVFVISLYFIITLSGWTFAFGFSHMNKIKTASSSLDFAVQESMILLQKQTRLFTTHWFLLLLLHKMSLGCKH